MELLVVFSIVAILAGLLLGVINQSRSSADRTRCLTSLRQLGAANLLYAQDHQGMVIPSLDPKGFPPLFWPDKVWVQSVQAYTGEAPDATAIASDSQGQPVNTGGNRGAPYCPAISRVTKSGRYTGYGWNGNWASPYFYKIHQFPAPSRTVLAWDDTQVNLSNGQGDNPNGGWPSSRRSEAWWYELNFRHGGQCHLLMLDGHVKSVSRGQFGDARDFPELVWQSPQEGY